jgi:hypothetical protein
MCCIMICTGDDLLRYKSFIVFIYPFLFTIIRVLMFNTIMLIKSKSVLIILHLLRYLFQNTSHRLLIGTLYERYLRNHF